MSLHVDTSVQLVWALANTEANLAGDDRIRPVHFFLGVLKVVDRNFHRQLDGVELPEGARELIVANGKGVRQYLEMTGDEVTKLRRSIRHQLREGKSARKEAQMLHRSDESRAVFQAAVEKAVQANAPALSVGHLTEALFATGSISLDKLKTVKARPGSKGARWEMLDDERKAGQQRFADWFGRNLSRLATEGALAPFVGRDAELKVLIRVLARTRGRHVAIAGGAGVGKTALVEGLALMLSGKKVPSALKDSEILELHGSDVSADCEHEAQLSRRLMHLSGMLGRRKTGILFIDDLVGMFPSHLKPEAAYSVLTTILAEDVTPVIVTTSSEQWAEMKNAAPSLARRFHLITLGEPSPEECHGIAFAWARRIGASHGIGFSTPAILAVLEAVYTMPAGRTIPDLIVDLLESVATFVKVSLLSSRSGGRDVTADDVWAAVAER